MGNQKLKNFIILTVLLALLTQGLTASKCPPIKIRKDTIIRTKESIDNGARMLFRSDIDSSRECYEICCERKSCNVGIVHYKKKRDKSTGEVVTSKTCFVFACGSPNLCIFMNHTGYAVIEMQRKKAKAKVKPVEIVHPIDEEDCPAGSPVAMCSEDPCKRATCPGHKSARCVANYCGGCNAFFYNNKGKKIQCGEKKLKAKTVKSQAMPTKAASTEEEKSSAEEPNKDDTNVNEEEVEIKPEDTGGRPTEDPNSPDENEDPHKVKQFRTWLDAGEDYITENPLKTTKTPASVSKANNNGTQDDLISINNESRKSTGHGKKRESRVTLTLAIALGICIVVLLAVLVKLKCMGPKKKKKFAVDDGDYLINGMYL